MRIRWVVPALPSLHALLLSVPPRQQSRRYRLVEVEAAVEVAEGEEVEVAAVVVGTFAVVVCVSFA